MRSIPLLFLTLAACGAGEGKRTTVAQESTHATAAAAGTVVDTTAKTAPARADTLATSFADDSQIVRALYVNRWASQSPKRMHELVAIADSTEINAFVIDMKDEFGLNFESADSMVKRNAGNAGKVPHVKELLDSLRAHQSRSRDSEARWHAVA
jgi:hypothetical protein